MGNSNARDSRTAHSRRSAPRAATPSLRHERSLIRRHGQLLLAADEVGRGSCAGPVSVGVVVVDLSMRPVPGVKDSKLLSSTARERLAREIRGWAVAHAVGHASAGEIDELGLIPALRLAAGRATTLAGVDPDVVLVDGNIDWFNPADRPRGLAATPPVYTKIRADRTCASVAAASILAKVTRDSLMEELDEEFPGYGWKSNKGYVTAAHLDAIRLKGYTDQHRKSWNLPL